MSNDHLRALGDALRINSYSAISAALLEGAPRMALGDAILAGLEAVELVDAIEYEIREEAAFRGVCNDASASTSQAWEWLHEDIDRDRKQLTAIREALEATGALSPSDRTTNLAALITALFAT